MPSKARRVDQRADQRVRLARIADLDRRIDLLEPRHQAVVDAVMHEQAPQRGAALAGRAHGREGDGAHRQIEIGRGRDDRGVVAAELEDRAGEARGEARADRAAHGGRAGGRHDGHAVIVDQGLADARGRRSGRSNRPSGASPNRRAARSSKACGGERGQRRLLRRLPDHRVAADEGERRVPGPHRDRES